MSVNSKPHISEPVWIEEGGVPKFTDAWYNYFENVDTTVNVTITSNINNTSIANSYSATTVVGDDVFTLRQELEELRSMVAALAGRESGSTLIEHNVTHQDSYDYSQSVVMRFDGDVDLSQVYEHVDTKADRGHDHAGMYATSTQGELAETALQPGDNVSELTNDAGYITSASVITDHGALTGLGDDDHTQYYNQSRGDARYVQNTALAAASGVATLDAGGKLLTSQLPALAITETFVVASQAAMLALSSAEEGDVAVRTDENKSYILAGTDPSVLADWQELLTPTSAVTSVNGQTGSVVLDADDIDDTSTTHKFTSSAEISKLAGIETGAQVNTVTSVAGKTGAVTLVKADVGLGNVDNTSDLNKPISTATQTALDGKVSSTDPRLSDSREWTASTVGQAEAEAGTATTRRAWTAQRVRQAIAAWWNTITLTKADITDFNESDYATGAEGDLATSAIQPGDNISELVNDAGYVTSAGVADHGALTGLGDDDHTQYHNNTRGDARYTQRANNLSDLSSAASARTNLGLGNVDNTTDLNKPISTATQAELDLKVYYSDIIDALNSTDGGVPLSAAQGKVLKDAIDAINIILASDEVSLDTIQEIVDFIQQNRDDLNNLGIGNIAGLQSALDAKQATITGGASTIVSSNLTANRALIANGSGKAAVSAVTATELGYLSGATSNIQAQIDGISSGGVTDHGALTGLGDDDHTQYHNDARGDARYLQLSNAGTAAVTNVATSPVDTTSGRVMTTGLLGWGGNTNVRELFSYAGLVATPSGFATVFEPAVLPGTRHTLHMRDSGGNGFDIACRAANNEISVRSITAGTPAGFVNLYHSGNLVAYSGGYISASGSFTFSAAAANTVFQIGGGVTVTIPFASSVDFPIGTVIGIRGGASTSTLTGGSVLLASGSNSPGNQSLLAHRLYRLVKIGTNIWTLGEGSL